MKCQFYFINFIYVGIYYNSFNLSVCTHFFYNAFSLNPQPCKTEGDIDAEGPHVTDESEMEWKSPKVPPAIIGNPTHWKRQQNKRFVLYSVPL